MLLIGSRAIRHHFPEFRPPRDWDLIGTNEDIERLDQVLPRGGGTQRLQKVHYMYGDVLVELANASASAYWAEVLGAFSNEPVLEDPVLGSFHIAPPGYLLLTKHCPLIYRTPHWHKNLEDLYFLRERLPQLPAAIAALLPATIDDSRRTFGRRHAHTATEPWACHPELSPPSDSELHRELHKSLALGATPIAWVSDAWLGFPKLTAETRRQNMIDMLAEEAMVLAAEQFLRPAVGMLSMDESQLTRWALRALITGRLPEAWRYFGVNYYREIRNRIPIGWMERIEHLSGLRVLCSESCHSEQQFCIYGPPPARAAEAMPQFSSECTRS